ncbi:MAG: hypothetical protein EOO27_48650, partial [Comamonadaceae bacterium]
LSHANNKAYLAGVAGKTETLTAGMRALIARPGTDRMIDVLGQAQALPAHSGLSLASPPFSYQYGLYVAEPIADAARKSYGRLQDRLIVPVITHRMEAVMRGALADSDATTAYDALRVYLLLHDKERFAASSTSAAEVRSWVIRDWQAGAPNRASQAFSAKTSASQNLALQDRAENLTPPRADVQNRAVQPSGRGGADASAGRQTVAAGEPDLATAFGNSAAMVSHLEHMFAGQRLVQSETVKNEALVRQVRDFLGASASSDRLYQRTRAALLTDAPPDFTLVRALGPQAGTLFSRASGKTLEHGVPGFFTYDGYHLLFAKRLPEMAKVAMADDAWVMGRGDEPASLSAVGQSAAANELE